LHLVFDPQSSFIFSSFFLECVGTPVSATISQVAEYGMSLIKKELQEKEE
jgi:hypothetical protein